MLLGLTACAGDAQFRAYVMADRLSYDVLKRHYIQMLDASDLSPVDKETHKGRMEAKELQITEAEKLLGLKQ